MLALWNGTLGEQAAMAAKYDWFYLRCPLGGPALKLLRHVPDGTWAGTCTTGRRRMLALGRPLRAGLQADLAVAAAHRSLGPALMLQQAAQASAAGQFDFLYGFPNPRASTIFRRLGWTHLLDAVRYARVLRHRRYLARRLPDAAAAPLAWVLDAALAVGQRLRRRRDVRASWSGRVDPRMDALWAAAPHDDALVTVRNAAYLRWRFDECPLARTRYLLLSAPDGALLAWFATREGGDVLVVQDFWSIDGTRGMAAPHVDALLAAARSAGHAAVSVEVAMDPSRLTGWRARGFAERARRPVYGRVPGIDGAPCPAPPYFTAADEDQ